MELQCKISAQQTHQLQPTPYEHVMVGGSVAVVSSACVKLEALVTWPLYCIQRDFRSPSTVNTSL